MEKINLFITIFLLQMIGWFPKYKKYTSLFKGKKIINLNSYVLIACFSGYLLDKSNITKLDQILIIYWSIGYLLFSFFIILFFKELLNYKKSSKKIIGNFSKIYSFIGLTYIFTAFAINKFSTISDILMILLFILCWVILEFLSEEPKRENVPLVDEESDVEIESYVQLLPTRKNELKKIIDILDNNNYDEPFAMTLNGDWGIGKTSLVNVLSNELDNKGNHRIFIQPMVLDTTEKLMDYFFNQLNNILSTNGVYTGKDSPFKKYVNILIQTINTVNMKPIFRLTDIFEIIDGGQEVDYREIKRLLEADIQKLLSEKKNSNSNWIKNKIYIIVDDFDRVEEDTYKNTLIFIKELVNFKGINIIFLMDDRKLEENKINREYMDKFVNMRFQLSNIEYDELLNYFIKNINKDKLKTEFIKNISNSIKKECVNYANNIFKGFENKAEEIQSTIDDLTVKNEEKENSRKLQLESDKKELIEHLHRLKEALSNVRKLKKIVREIKNILFFLDQECLNNADFKRNLDQISHIEELILKLAVVKIVFSKYVDIILKNNDIVSIILEKNSKIENYVIAALFNDLGKRFYDEKQGIKLNILNEFCNAIIMNKLFSAKILDKMITESERILKELDGVDELQISSIEDINEFLRVIYFHSWGEEQEKVQLRVTKIINYIFNAYAQGKIALKNLFEVFSDPQRNIFLNDNNYISKLNSVLDYTVVFQDKNEKSICITYLEGIEMPIFLRYRADILRIMSFLKIKDPIYRYENFAADYGDIYSLNEMTKEIVRMFEEKTFDYVALDYFESWFANALNSIKGNNGENEYILNSLKIYEEKLKGFIKFFRSIEELKLKISNTPVKQKNKFNEKLSYFSYEELKFEIIEFHRYIFLENNSIYNFMKYFNSLVNALERYSRNNDIDFSIIEKIEDVYRCINIEKIGVNSEEKSMWLWCTVNIGIIKENLKSNQQEKSIDGNGI